MLKPLTQFICDHCGHIIETPEKAYLEWENINDKEGKSRATNFKIVHHDAETNTFCSVRPSTATLSLEKFTGPDGIGALLSFYDQGEFVEPVFSVPRALNLREFTDIFRRLTIPFYEEGRQYLQFAFDDGFISSNQYGIYRPEKLQAFIEKYSPAVQ
ncbi:hypothetical protein [Mucilaginibacter paludis]|uniref:Uncharacterized protein n=1 Tax=Mucilaginibacter paludis DSM 18603 TaxID=714943 RepID=H1Y5N5_9SPHI|nr:hypothetical protein [Mucilaginibacter paludis]EHQ29811.1 hypothetical protein Mucpa_5743 [Mucilaginibacter paludis DSM 18603]